MHDAHPQYLSTTYALGLQAAQKIAVQHHRAHIASVLAEHGAWDKRVLGISFDGTGYGDDGSIWGGEFFAGSVREGFERVAHLRRASLPGGDAAAQHPVQAAAGFLAQIEGLPDLTAAPFDFPARYRQALELVSKQVRSFTTTSVGRLFDSAAALLGFTRAITFEGQAAMWVESLAREAGWPKRIHFPSQKVSWIFGRLLLAVAEDRKRGRSPNEIARAFQLRYRQRDVATRHWRSAVSSSWIPSCCREESSRTSFCSATCETCWAQPGWSLDQSRRSAQ